jgi:iron complex transport system substrate-binding protein
VAIAAFGALVIGGTVAPRAVLAQQASAILHGRIVLGRDSVPVSGQPVMLHGITGDSGAALDSAVTDRKGAFTFTLQGDTARTVFLVAVRYDDVLYFGDPIREVSPPEPYVVQVFPSRSIPRPDTVPLTRRSLVITYEGGGARVLDAIQLDNAGDTALVASGSGAGAWRVALPQGAEDPRALSGDMFPGGIQFQSGFALLEPSLRPGTSQVLIQYRLPSDRAPSLTPVHPVQRLEVLWSGTDRDLIGAGFQPAEPVSFHGDTYRALVASFVPAGTSLTMALTGGSSKTVAWLFILTGLLLAAAAYVTWRRTGGRGTGGGTVALAILLVLGPWSRANAAERPCCRDAPRQDSFQLQDDLGRTVRLAAPPRRIVSLVPAMTELLFAVGAGNRLVGRTRYGVHPPEARSVPSVGQGVHPSVETVVARHPDLVLVYAGSGSRAVVRELDGLGVPSLAVRHDDFADLYRNIGRLGLLTARPLAARALAARIRCELRTVARASARWPRRSVYLDVWEDPPYTVGSGSYLDSLIRVAGGRDVFGDLPQASPRVSLEAIAARDPDVVIVPRSVRGRLDPSRRPAWRAIPAVAAGRVREVDGDLIDRLGPRVGEAAGALAAAIHPELAGDPSVSDPARACGGIGPPGGNLGRARDDSGGRI